MGYHVFLRKNLFVSKNPMKADVDKTFPQSLRFLRMVQKMELLC